VEVQTACALLEQGAIGDPVSVVGGEVVDTTGASVGATASVGAFV